MDAVVPSAEPAAPVAAEPQTVSPTRAAAAANDFAAFDRAELAARDGKPQADVPAPTPAPEPTRRHSGLPPKPEAAAAPADAAAPAEQRLTREQKEQQRINEAIQRGIEAATAPLRSELDALKAGRKPAEEPAKPASVPDYKRLMALPGAPKMADFDSVEEHAIAAAVFVNQALTAERTAQDTNKALASDLESVYVNRIESFVGQLKDAKEADPTFVSKISPQVLALQPGVTTGPLSVVAEQIFDSVKVPAVALELSKPGVLDALVAMPPVIAAVRDQRQREWLHRQHIIREFNRLEGRILASTESTAAPAPEASTPRSPISTAPAPAPRIDRARATTDPKVAAINKNDFAAFDKIEQEREQAKRRARAGA